MDLTPADLAKSNIAMGGGGEFDAIRELLTEWGAVAEGIGDDAAILSVPAGHQLVVSTDATVEDVHFRRKWISAHDAGARAATAALSDIAAMGAIATGVLISFVVPTVWREHLREFSRGIKQSVQAANARIIGGNISRGATFSCTLTVIGHAVQPVRRSTAAAGNQLYVTGTLGGPGAAVAAWEAHSAPQLWALARFIHPVARLQEGLWLAANGATAMIDVSDALAADSGHLAAASGCGCVLLPDQVPRFPGVTPEAAMASGEEYELLVALSADRSEAVAHEFAKHFGFPLTRVGHLTPHTHGAVAGDGEPNSTHRVELPPGHDHFSTG